MKRLTLGLVITSLVSLVFGLNCHQCQTLEYKTCKDPYTTSDSDSCDDNDEYFCTKVKTIVKIRDSGYIDGWERHSQIVTRGCQRKKGHKEGCTAWQNNGGITIKCWCGTDDCNSGSVLLPSGVALLVPFLCLSFIVLKIPAGGQLQRDERTSEKKTK